VPGRAIPRLRAADYEAFAEFDPEGDDALIGEHEGRTIIGPAAARAQLR
jgi:hypothetical protein